MAVDSIEETSRSAGEIIAALSSGCIKRTEINELKDLVSGSTKRRVDSKSENSYFKSIGVGIEDLAIARFLYSNLSGKD